MSMEGMDGSCRPWRGKSHTRITADTLFHGIPPGDDDASDIGDAPAPKQSSKPAEAAKKTGAGSINSAPSTRRVVPGQSRPQKQVEVVSPTDTVSPSAAAGFEGERGRDDRGALLLFFRIMQTKRRILSISPPTGTGFGRGRGAGRGRGERGTGARGAGRGGRGGRPERPDRRSQTGRECVQAFAPSAFPILSAKSRLKTTAETPPKPSIKDGEATMASVN